jgi:flagellar protein FliS
MYQTGIQQALNQYRNAGPLAEVNEADPHRLVQMLFEGALDRLAVARGAMLQGDTAVKGERISRAIGIIDGLRAHLDMEQGGELAANLESLYEYMERRLVEANLHDDVRVLDEVTNLLREIKSGWDALPQQKSVTAAHG